ncbi:hypothetical protein V8G54_037399 [Vigna mungo]|uniref:25S rRNA (uridine-N(3))-methyltransferase BMT5-like domain-containing protein n=1 Tax=Vigna mungo TaxID=3915 RepID=A0AAQ3RHG2_VIGMU
MIATSLESRVSLSNKYRKTSSNIMKLENLNCTVIHKVNAHTMSKHYILSRKRFNRIVYNFPHVGFSHDENSIEMIKKQQYLVMGFLQNAKLMLEKDGEIHVTHKKDPPFLSEKLLI